MTTIFLVEGEHHSVPGNPMSAHATQPLADAKARELVNIIRQDALYDPVTASFSLILPQLTGEFDWKEALREWQRAKIADDYEAAEITAMDDDDLADASETTVWITPLELEDEAPTAGCDDPELIAQPQPVRVAVNTTGGLVQWALADGPGVELIVIDFDVEGHTDFDLTLVTDDDGTTAPATVRGETVQIDPLYFARLDTAPIAVNGLGDFYGDDDEDQESDETKWLVSAQLGIPGPDGGFDNYSGWVPGETAAEASRIANAIIERRFPDGTRVFTMHVHPPVTAR